MKFFLLHDEVIAEIEAPSALAASCAEEACEALDGTTLCELSTGNCVAERRRTARGLAWVFRAADAWSEEADSSRRSVA